MLVPERFVRLTWAAGFALVLLPLSLSAQGMPAAATDPGALLAASAELPEAPTPQIAPSAPAPAPAASIGQSANPTPSSSSAQQPDPALPAASSSSSSSASAVQPSPQAAQSPSDSQARHDQAEQQLKQQEHQRVAGIMAAFNTTRNQAALPLSPGQKFELFFKSETDPWPFSLCSAVAGIEQADDSFPQWGQGMQGYGKRLGAAYSDAFMGNFFGNAVLPSLLHEDPRFFQKTTGSFMSRFLWAAASTGWARRDNGTWGPNYANVGGNLIGAAIARVYYPADERTASDVIFDGLTVSAEGVVGAEVIEFWPSIVALHKRKMAQRYARQHPDQMPSSQ